MYRFCLFSLVIFLSFSCKNVNSTLFISGKVDDTCISTLFLMGPSDTISIGVDTNQSFVDTLQIPAGYYDLSVGDSAIALYLKPGFRLNVNLGKNMEFSGKGATENKYLQTKRELETSLQGRDNEHCFAYLPEPQFLSLMDSLYEVRLNLLEQNSSGMDDEFYYFERSSLKYEYARKKSLYETDVRGITGNMKFEVSADYYPRLFQDIDLNDSLLVDLTDYIQFIGGYLWQAAKAQINGNDSIDFYYTYMTILDQEITAKKVKEKLSFNVGIYKLERTNRLDDVYRLVAANLSKPEYQQCVEMKYKNLKKIEKGAVSPDFQFEDADGKLVALKDLRGKIVYIDIWSTGCVYCIAEMPFWNQVEASLKGKNICFVGINVGDSEADWKNALKEKRPGGIQLHSEDSRADFFEDYVVRGIPRYILLDAQGRIISSSALRPSDDKLKDQLEKLL